MRLRALGSAALSQLHNSMRALLRQLVAIPDLLRLLDEAKAAGARFRAIDDPWCDTSPFDGASASLAG